MFIVGDALFIKRRAILLIMLASGIASSFSSNTGTTAIFIPIIIGVSRGDGFSRSRLMMPLCLSATIGALSPY